MSKELKYWRGVEELENTPEFTKLKENEFAEQLPMDEFLGDSSLAEGKTPRRDFLKFLGFGVTAATLAACETPVTKTIPYLFKPEEVTVGIANYYASTYFDGHEYCSVLVKTREGRPIKIIGNEMSPVTLGGANARVQASILNLYDAERLKGASKNGAPVSWAAADKEIGDKLAAIAGRKGKIAILSSTIISPSTTRAIEEFTTKYGNVEVVQYDSVSYAGIRTANALSFGKEVIPTYHFDKAETIVGIGADFLATWLSPIEFASQYAKGKRIAAGADHKETKLSRHFQFEAAMSLTGSNADLRTMVKPSDLGVVAINLYNEVAKAKGKATLTGRSLGKADASIAKAAKELVASAGKSLVVAGSNNPDVQVVVNAINDMLGNYGNTINLTKTDETKKGNDKAVANLVAQMNAGAVEAVLLYNVNPVYTLPNAKDFSAGLKKVGLRVSFAANIDESAAECEYVCPDNNFLESWNDFNPRTGEFSLAQPTIAPIYNTRQAQESFLVWAGNPTPYADYIKATWQAKTFPGSGFGSFTDFWNKALHDGLYSVGGGLAAETAPAEAVAPVKADEHADPAHATPHGRPQAEAAAAPVVTAAIAADPAALSTAAANLNKVKSGAFELVVYEKAGLGNGNLANNPWLQEMPDPITKVTWDNYITMSLSDMATFEFNTINGQEQLSNVAEIVVNGITLKLPVYAQPGQAKGTIGIALGYGRTKAGKTANNIGANAFAAVSVNKDNGHFEYNAFDVKVSKTDETYNLAGTQTHHTMMGRAIVKEATVDAYKKDAKAGNAPILLALSDGTKDTPGNVNLWEDHPRLNHKWGMSIDLNTCIGCSACVIGCQTENNVAVVGKDEIRRGRDMHWIRIDRYYTSDMTEHKAEEEGVGAIKKFLDMEIPSESPRVVFQPVMCQHCNHAPCETVCPVLATTHSNEGLNQMTYNRCIGTKYCGNNCPYKVRRFNWFKYADNPQQFDFHMADTLGKMVLNPDVIVRGRGVMEKCSMCVQRIQEGKLNAKKENRRPIDGEIKTACQQVCPTNAITFGDLNDESHTVTKHINEPRMYHLLEEVGIQPSVFYLTKVRNVSESEL
jgi:MoCo/4Fe-4S cofactor protein with predicted Tat translocation signal